MASVNSVDMNKALTSESYAAQLIRSNKLTAAQRGKIVAQWGADKVKFWQSVDSTEYQISDDDKNTAREKGRQTTADSVGYDGSKNHSAWKDVGNAAATTCAHIFRKQVGKGISNAANKVAGKHVLCGSSDTNKNLGDIACVILASAEVARYIATKPNKEQYDAIMKLFESEYPQGIDSLNQAQESMIEATEENTELTDEAQEKNEEANDTIEEDKTKMDFYKAQYEALVMKANAAANGGEPLTADEKALLQKLAPLLVEIVGSIEDTNDEASEELTDLYDQIGEYQDRYDEGAETIAEVQGMTDFSEGFDESTRTMCYVEAAAQTLNGVSAGLAAARLYAKSGLTFGATLVFAAMGTVASAMSLNFATGFGGMGTGKSQMGMASDISAAIDERRNVQDMEDVATEVYDEELENFAGNLEIIEDQEIEIPEDLEVPTETVPVGGDGTGGTSGTDGTDGTEGSGNPFADTRAGIGEDEGDGTGGTGGADGTGGNANAPGVNGNGDGEDNGTIPPEKDPAYVSKMGYGKDWTEVTEGNVKRGSDDEIVTQNGKVLLTGTYADAITKVTGAKEGEAFSKSDIPEILEELLGDPFTAEMIKKVRAGKQLDSEYAAKILKTKSQEDAGSGTVDNSKKATQIAKQVIDFYYPIFEQAATKGWTRG